jgi:hypothetical protein
LKYFAQFLKIPHVVGVVSNSACHLKRGILMLKKKQGYRQDKGLPAKQLTGNFLLLKEEDDAR